MSFDNWDNLLYGIHTQRCILFLGPEFPCIQPGRRPLPAQELLIARLERELPTYTESVSSPDSAGLPAVAERFLFDKNSLELERQVTEWHESLHGVHCPAHAALASLPFERIIASSHDPLMESALAASGKPPVVKYYNYAGGRQELLPKHSVERPLLYHLYGHIDDPDSVVLTESRLLDFLVALISKSPALPNDLNDFLTNGRLFLFLGFRLDQWHLRILLHVLKVLERDGFAIEQLRSTLGGRQRDAVVFFGTKSRIAVYEESLPEFVQQLAARYAEKYHFEGSSSVDEGTGGSEEQAKVFLCHATEDAAKAREIADYLSQYGLAPWLDQDQLRGGDRWADVIPKVIPSVRHFVVLNSEALARKAEAAHYVNLEINEALEARKLRLRRNYIVPVRIDSQPVLPELDSYQAVDLNPPCSISDLVKALKRRQPAGSSR